MIREADNVDPHFFIDHLYPREADHTIVPSINKKQLFPKVHIVLSNFHKYSIRILQTS